MIWLKVLIWTQMLIYRLLISFSSIASPFEPLICFVNLDSSLLQFNSPFQINEYVKHAILKSESLGASFQFEYYVF